MVSNILTNIRARPATEAEIVNKISFLNFLLGETFTTFTYLGDLKVWD